MSNIRKLSIILISLSVALVLSILGIVLVLVDKEKSVNTEFSFRYDNRVSVFQVQNAANKGDFDSIDTTLGNILNEPNIVPSVGNMAFDGWYLDEECETEAIFPVWKM